MKSNDDTNRAKILGLLGFVLLYSNSANAVTLLYATSVIDQMKMFSIKFAVFSAIILSIYYYGVKAIRNNKNRSILDKLPNEAVPITPNPVGKLELERTVALQNPDTQTSFIKNRFLTKYPVLDTEYKKIQLNNNSIQNSLSFNSNSKQQASELTNLADNLLQNLYALDRLNKINDEVVLKLSRARRRVTTHYQIAVEKMSDISLALEEIVDLKVNQIGMDMSNMVMPVEIKVQGRIEHIKNKGFELIERMGDDPSISTVEDKLVLEKIVNHRLDEIWGNYQSAKKASLGLDNSTNKGILNISNNSETGSVDDVVNKLLDEVDEYLQKVQEGVSSTQRSDAMNKLLSDQLYFQERNMR